MKLSYIFEEFSSSDSDTLTLPPEKDEASQNDARLEGFEEGYAAGWEDSQGVIQNTHHRASAALARSLEDATFTHRDAQTQLIAGTVPMLQAITDQLVPECFGVAQRGHVLENLKKILAEQFNRSVEICTSSDEVPAMTSMLSELPVAIRGRAKVVPDLELSSSEVRIRYGESATRIDMADLAAEIRKAFDAFFETIKEVQPDA